MGALLLWVSCPISAAYLGRSVIFFRRGGAAEIPKTSRRQDEPVGLSASAWGERLNLYAACSIIERDDNLWQALGAVNQGQPTLWFQTLQGRIDPDGEVDLFLPRAGAA